MRVLDDADEVPERVNDGGDLDAAADIGNRLARPGAMMEEPLVGRGDIRYAPVRHGVVAQRRLRSVSECRRVEGPALDGPGAPQALVCSACHGFGGQSQSNTMPILAGIAPWYFKKAIQDYAAGKRQSPEMEPYAKQVLQFGVDDVAAYFAAQPRTATPVKPEPAAVERGRAAAVLCTVCHGVSGKGARMPMDFASFTIMARPAFGLPLPMAMEIFTAMVLIDRVSA